MARGSRARLEFGWAHRKSVNLAEPCSSRTPRSREGTGRRGRHSSWVRAAHGRPRAPRAERIRGAPRRSSASFEFGRVRESRIVQEPTQIDFLFAGDPIRRAPADVFFPDPDEIASSPGDAAYVGLAPLLELELWSYRKQDVADAVALLEKLQDIEYDVREAHFDPRLRPELWRLRQDALAELSWEARG